jgi:hydrogenase maturation protein HypF
VSRQNIVRRKILVRGIVQGVGFRPHVFNLAQALGLTGCVGNDSTGAFVEVQGTADAVAALQTGLGRCPQPCTIESIQLEELAPVVESDFAIVESESRESFGVVVPADIATCVACLTDLNNACDRRHRYPFTTCARCGPRFTVIRELPYDRERTTMVAFRMCVECAAEYAKPSDLRFHAQSSSCPDCGPRVWFEQSANSTGKSRGDPIKQAQAALEHGEIVAIKGIGGFHLACDATNDVVVRRLRERKGRGDKPFALMARDQDVIRRYADLSKGEEAILSGLERPIVLLRLRNSTELATLSPAIAPGQNHLGFMLPYSPLHHLLVTDRPLVMTSGNRSEAPIVIDNTDALTTLSAVADCFLLHDREILVSCDDSVVQVFREKIYPVRRSRGFAPLPIRLATDGPAILAAGAELKATFCLLANDRGYLSQHLGDVASLETLSSFTKAVDHLRQVLKIDPEAIACDHHPGYLSSRWASEFARSQGLPLIRVWHHHAHVAALLGEHGRIDPIIGVCFDGTGYGQDGAIWGGEFLIADVHKCHRAAHLDYVPLPGGDAAIEKPYRMALAHLWAAGDAWDDALPCVRASSSAERRVLRTQIAQGINTPRTSSIGRLFDAVASLVGVRQTVSYEAQAAIELQAMADPDAEPGYEFPLLPGDPLRIDSRPVIRQIAHAVKAGESTAVIAGRFHRGLAEAVVQVCRAVREQTGLDTVGLTGGVFQNLLLLEHTVNLLERDRFEVLVHSQVPANDGGLSLGQALIARSVIATRTASA